MERWLCSPGGRGPPFFSRVVVHRQVDRGPEEVTVLGSLTIVAQTDGTGGSFVGLLLPLLFMGAIFYFLLIRPQQRRQRAQRGLIEGLGIGDEVITIGGLYGTIRGMDEESVTLEVDEDVQVRFLKSAIARKLVFDQDDEPAEEQQGAGEQT
jgi:preprotein translocase subunit YajC